MKCLVFGGNGFLGRHLCTSLLSQGYRVRVFDRPMRDKTLLLDDIEFYEGDFTNEQDVERAIEGCDIIFHLISTTLPKSSNDNPVYDVESNVVGTIRMLTLALKQGVRKVIFTSSGGTVYGIPESDFINERHPTNPICSYGISKLAIEKYLHLFHELHGLAYVVLRISNPYGEGQRTQALQGAIGVFIGRALTDQTVEIWGDGEVVRDYIHVSDVSDALVKAMLYSGNKRVFNIGSGTGTSLNKLLATIEDATHKEVKRVYLSGRSVDVPVNVLDNTLAKKELHWNLKIPLEEGIKRTIDIYLKQKMQ